MTPLQETLERRLRFARQARERLAEEEEAEEVKPDLVVLAKSLTEEAGHATSC
jgi:hypothetical protein